MAPLIEQFGWRSMFLGFGGLGFLVALPAVIGLLRDDGPYRQGDGGDGAPLWAVFRNGNYRLVVVAGSSLGRPRGAFLASSLFFQDAYQTAEFALVQRILPPQRVGAATGLYNGMSIILGWAGGTTLIGKVVEVTGSYDSGLMVVVVAGLLNAFVLGILYRRIKYRGHHEMRNRDPMRHQRGDLPHPRPRPRRRADPQ